MTIKTLTDYLESLAPISSQESYDNCGLLTGDKNTEVSGALLCLDCTEAVIEEAITLDANLIIAHHPIVFKGLKSITGKNYVERTLIKAIKNDIAIYAIHTNLDNYKLGVNYEIGKRLGLENLKILAPKQNELIKLVVFCPKTHTYEVKNSLFSAGAGAIGNYEACSFLTEGKGTFTPMDGSNPTLGKHHTPTEVEEEKIEVLVTQHNLSQVLQAMHNSHPYEEVAHDIIPLLNQNQFSGAGMIGELAKPTDSLAFLKDIKSIFKCGSIKYTPIHKEKIQRVAFCGGSGSFLVKKAIQAKADIYITGDMKYHEFFDAENRIIIADIGHFESEQYTPNLIHAVLKKKFINFAFYLSKVNTNPINYI